MSFAVATSLVARMAGVAIGRRPGPGFSRVLHWAAVLAAVGYALRRGMSATGVAAIYTALTVGWVLAVAYAFRLLDGVVGLAPWAGLVTAVVTLVTATLADHRWPLDVSAAVVGACAAVVAVRRPAMLGRLGSLLVGAVLGIVALNATPAGRLPAPSSSR